MRLRPWHRLPDSGRRPSIRAPVAGAWALIIRNCFVREEGDRLILCAGIPARWLDQNTPISFGPAPTAFGTLGLTITPAADQSIRIDWRGTWHRDAPPLEIRLPGFPQTSVAAADGSITLTNVQT